MHTVLLNIGFFGIFLFFFRIETCFFFYIKRNYMKYCRYGVKRFTLNIIEIKETSVKTKIRLFVVCLYRGTEYNVVNMNLNILTR